VDVMRVLLDHELLTLKEAQRFLNVNRCTINEMIDTGKLHAIKIGSQWKIAGWSLKKLFLEYCQSNNFEDEHINEDFCIDASNYEMSMIAEWT
jgi:excisionase family DNA binding protein